jgi:hypothetical protein
VYSTFHSPPTYWRAPPGGTGQYYLLRQEPVDADPALGATFSLEEIDQALFRMANHKAPGADGIPAELLKYCGPQGRELLLLLCNLIHNPVCIQHGWREGTLVSVPKSGDLTNCSNYRGLTPLLTITQLFTHLLLQRVPPHVQLNDHQCGFLRGRGTADALLLWMPHDFHWVTSSLTVVDQLRYLGIWLTSSWSWDTHIAAAYRKGLGAFHSWRPVLMSSRFLVAAKLRIIHSVIRPGLEYGMEAWGPPDGSEHRKRMRGGSRPCPPLQHFENLLLSACRLVCGVHGEAGWTRRACVSPAVLFRARGYRQKDAGTGTRTGKWKNAGTVPFVPGSWSNNIDLLGQRVPSMVQGMHACNTVTQLPYNDGCTAASIPYPYKGVLKVL